MSSQFSPGEIPSIVVAWIVLSIGISFRYFFGAVNGNPISIQFVVASFIATATAFVIHEMGHKFVAISRGYVAHFRVWAWGLGITLLSAVVSGGGIVFGAPGAVYIAPAVVGYYSEGFDVDQENMIISLAGPGINLVFAVVFLIEFLIFPRSGLITSVSQVGFALNVGLGSFNMLPIPPLDGSKIFRKSIPVALAIALPLWAMVLYFFLL